MSCFHHLFSIFPRLRVRQYFFPERIRSKVNKQAGDEDEKKDSKPEDVVVKDDYSRLG